MKKFIVIFVISILLLLGAVLLLYKPAHAAILGTIADATCNTSTSTPIVPASSKVQCSWLTNSGSNPARIGDVNVGSGQGAQLVAGSPGAVLCQQGPIYCYSASGTTINITQLLGPQ